MDIFLRYAKKTCDLPNNFITKAYDCRILFILNGTGKIWLDNKEYLLKENTLCYYPAATPYFPKSSDDFPMEFVTLNFDFNRNYTNFVNAFAPVAEKDFLSDRAVLPTEEVPEIFKSYFVLENAVEYREDFLKLVNEFSADVPYGKEKAETKLKYLLLSMTTHSFCKENRIFEETLSYIKNNILSINSNEEIAQFMNYHSYYLNKIFKEKTGTSMHRYIINERLKIAADLLITTSHNVNEVAKLSGFENSRHFSTAFMKKYKCTPSSMRKRSKTFI